MDPAAVPGSRQTRSAPPSAPAAPRPGDGRLGPGSSNHRPTIRLATELDRETIYRLRHEVYARELHQHHTNDTGRLTDPLDAFNLYLVISEGDAVVGFVSITPPGSPSFSVDKYLGRDQLPFPFDNRLYEVRLLTVPESNRRSLHALALMYAAFRWVESHGGNRIVAIGRREVMSMYERVGLKPVGLTVQSGAVTYEVMQTTMPEVHASLPAIRGMLDRIQSGMAWEIGVAYDTPAACYHGGAFFSAVGDEFGSLDKLDAIINADVLDAWFPPSPRAVEALQQHLPQLLRTSPPTGCEGLVRAIARTRRVPTECILPGAGSSDLIFRALRQWLTPQSRVLILDPTYGEYLHVLEQVIPCRVERLLLHRHEKFRLDPRQLEAQATRGYDLIILVNPNSPSGQHVPRLELGRVLRAVPFRTRVWVDETYVDYAGPGESLEPFAAGSENVIVCKSMSKTYALSGARVAYLCAGPHQLESLRPLTPPWVVSLPAQVAAVKALEDPDYYAARYAETHELREELAIALRGLGWEVLPSITNFLLCDLPADGPDAATLILRCRERGLFLRDAASMGSQLGDRAVRVAVKDRETNRRLVRILAEILTT